MLYSNCMPIFTCATPCTIPKPEPLALSKTNISDIRLDRWVLYLYTRIEILAYALSKGLATFVHTVMGHYKETPALRKHMLTFLTSVWIDGYYTSTRASKYWLTP